jgi:hypothetical protein
LAVGLYLNLIVSRLDPGSGRQAYERVTAKPLPTHHGLKQVAIRLIGKLQVKRKRCFEVGLQRPNQGNAVEALIRQGLEFRLRDHETVANA